ncbi:hypothetical protein NQ317_004244 [Molorchus minor]|uniref:PiggyBac transposable element-derived protein domain-containing protein n=1 Tax=Molorchus minor TaxID=1323400 RepID=A0ABQ9K0I1_9CUCU|nr:hypothetical protein NQ317_004244 [Molorchus minor]
MKVYIEGVPKSILTTVREKIEEPLRRNDLLTMKDIGNIRTSFNISLKDGQRHKDDVTSVELYDFEMTTILILDEFREGFPVAFMFSNRKDQFVFEVFFKVVKDTVNMKVINTKTFMTDMATVYYNAWISVMGCQSTGHLFCTWHVDKAWQQNLAKMKMTSKKEFSEFLTVLYTDEATHEMHTYLKQYYFHNRRQWAYCYRKSRGINTNMFLESMHKVIKYSYLDGKKVKRMDRTLHSIQKYIRDKAANRINKLIKGKRSKQVDDIIKRHRNALSSDFDMAIEDESFIFNNADRESHIVNKKSDTGVCCELKCSYCNICWHAFECTSLDYQIKNMICKHIHYVILKNFNQLQRANISLDDGNDKVKKVLENINKDTHLNCTSQIVEDSRTQLERKKDMVKNAAQQLISGIDTKCFSSEDYDFMLKNLKVLNSMGTVEIQTSQLKDALFKTTSVFPANKKIEKQKFFSTKKKRTDVNKKISKPNFEDTIIIKEMLSRSLYTSKESRRLDISELEKLPSADVFDLLDEIPSDNESILSDSESDDEENLKNMNADLDAVVDEIELPVANEELDWDSEDELPLAKFLPAANTALPKPTFQWSRNLNNIIQQTPFVENSGPNIPDDIETPLDYFFDIMRAQVPTTLEEIKCFLGVNILMGIKHLPSYKDYWSSREELRDHFIASSMSRNRFSWLLGNFHLNDNSVQPQKGESMYDKLYKLRPMLDKLSETYANSYKPSRCQAIDESIIRFKGRML